MTIETFKMIAIGLMTIILGFFAFCAFMMSHAMNEHEPFKPETDGDDEEEESDDQNSETENPENDRK